MEFKKILMAIWKAIFHTVCDVIFIFCIFVASCIFFIVCGTGLIIPIFIIKYAIDYYKEDNSNKK